MRKIKIPRIIDFALILWVEKEAIGTHIRYSQIHDEVAYDVASPFIIRVVFYLIQVIK